MDYWLVEDSGERQLSAPTGPDVMYQLVLLFNQSLCVCWQVINMASWITQMTVVLLSVFIGGSQQKRDKVLYCSGESTQRHGNRSKLGDMFVVLCKASQFSEKYLLWTFEPSFFR